MSFMKCNIVSSALRARVDWASDQPKKPLWPNGPLPMEYIDGLIRKPGMGSYVLRNKSPMEIIDEVGRMLLDVEWEETTPPLAMTKEGHKYYTGYLPLKGEFGEYEGFEAVSLLDELETSQLDQVRVRKGLHGLELCMPGSPRPTRSIVAITDADGLVTWYPGRLTPPINLAEATVKIS